MAEAWEVLGQTEKASGYYDAALENARRDSGPFAYVFNAPLLARIAVKYHKAGRKEEAARILVRARESAAGGENRTSEKAQSLAIIAGAYAETGESKKASKLLLEALKALADLDDRFQPDRSGGLASVAAAYVRTGIEFDDEAQKVLRAILDRETAPKEGR
ncbi:MAG: hypothetical protein HY897_22995 [Deltaproteobacteria bacterium]|nr:hypothetical protein [Deltaproteobacteria bacterium]